MDKENLILTVVAIVAIVAIVTLAVGKGNVLKTSGQGAGTCPYIEVFTMSARILENCCEYNAGCEACREEARAYHAWEKICMETLN